MRAIVIKEIEADPRHVRFDFKEIEINGLKDMQKAVDGDIEGWDYIGELFENGIVLFCNDEGKLCNLTPAVLVVDGNTFPSAKIVDQLCGNVLLCGYDFEQDKTVSLTDHQVEIISQVFRRARYISEPQIIDGFIAELKSKNKL